MSSVFLELLAFILVAGLIFFNESKSRNADRAKLILACGSSVWLVCHSLVYLVENVTALF